MRLMRLVRLRKLEGGDWPLAIMAFDRNSQAMPFVEPNVLDRPSLSVGKDHRLASEFGLSLFERAEDGRRTDAFAVAQGYFAGLAESRYGGGQPMRRRFAYLLRATYCRRAMGKWFDEQRDLDRCASQGRA